MLVKEITIGRVIFPFVHIKSKSKETIDKYINQ